MYEALILLREIKARDFAGIRVEYRIVVSG